MVGRREVLAIEIGQGLPVARHPQPAEARHQPLGLGRRADLVEARERRIDVGAVEDLEVRHAVPSSWSDSAIVSTSNSPPPSTSRPPWTKRTTEVVSAERDRLPRHPGVAGESDRATEDLQVGLAALELSPADEAMVDEPQVRRVEVDAARPSRARCDSRGVAVGELARASPAGRSRRRSSKCASASASDSNQSLRTVRPSEIVATSDISYSSGPPPADSAAWPEPSTRTAMRSSSLASVSNRNSASGAISVQERHRSTAAAGPAQHSPDRRRPVVDALVVRRPKLGERLPVARVRQPADTGDAPLGLGRGADLLEALERRVDVGPARRSRSA